MEVSMRKASLNAHRRDGRGRGLSFFTNPPEMLGPRVILDGVPKANAGGKGMFHLIWYVLIGLIAGVIAKSVMHVHITIFWTIVLGIIGSIIGGAVTHMFSRPANERYHPAGLIFSTLGAILVLFICYKLKIHFPQVGPF